MFYWPIDNPRVRYDNAGSGDFGAQRTKTVDGELITYRHKGTDLLGDPGAGIFALSTGAAERHGVCYDPDAYPKRKHLKLLVLTFPLGRIRLLYVEPLVQPGEIVTAGDRIATLQDVAAAHGPPVLNHLHIEIEIRRQCIMAHTGHFLEHPGLIDPMQLLMAAT